MEIKLIKDWFAHTLAYALPKRVLRYCVIRIWAELIVEVYPKKTPDQVTWDMAYRWLEDGSVVK